MISIEGEAPHETVEVAERFRDSTSKFEVEIVRRTRRLGLRDHILTLGDLSHDHDSVLLLEDDLTIDPYAYEFAKANMSAYWDVSDIAGHALYAPRINEYAWLPFEALENGYDTYFMQVPCSWGQLWTANQWSRFREWLERDDMPDLREDVRLPPSLRKWPDSSWKKRFAHFMASKNLWFTYPYRSFSTNHGESGSHLDGKVHHFQTPMPLPDRSVRGWSLCPSEDRTVAYDAFMEPCGTAISLICDAPADDVTVDAYGIKPLEYLQKFSWVITSKAVRDPEAVFPVSMRPIEQAILQPGEPNAGSPNLYLVRSELLNDEGASLSRKWLAYWLGSFVLSRRLVSRCLKAVWRR